MSNADSKESMQVLEFKIKPDAAFKEKVESWFYGLRHCWNYYLSEFIHFEEFVRYNKETKTYELLYTPPTSKRYDSISGKFVEYSSLVAPESIDLIKDAPKAKMFTRNADGSVSKNYNRDTDVLSSVIASGMGVNKKNEPYHWDQGWHGGFGYSCPIAVKASFGALRQEPKKIQAVGHINSEKHIQTTNLKPHIKKAMLKVPSKYRMSLLSDLLTSWGAYRDSKNNQNSLCRGRPKFKRYNDKITTVSHKNCKKSCVPIGNDLLKIPDWCGGLDDNGNKFKIKAFKLKVPGLDKRLNLNNNKPPLISVFKILKKPSGWYIQITIPETGEDLDAKKRRMLKNPYGGIGIDTGVKGVNFLSTDRFTIETTRWYRESEQKLKGLQRAIDKKRLSRLILWLNHPDNTIKHVKDVFSTISKDSLILAMQCKTAQQLSVLVSENKLSGLAYNRLKWYDFKRCRLPSCFLFDKLLSETSRERELVQKRGRIFEKQKRQRRARDHKISTWLVRKFKCIRVEDGLQNAVGKSKKKVAEDGRSFLKNRKKQRSGLNKSITDASIGQVLALIEKKADALGRDFKRMKPSFTRAYSQLCPVCSTKNEQQKDISGHSDFTCTNCGFHHKDRDVIPGINLMMEAFDAEEIVREDLSKESSVALRLREKWQAEHTIAPEGGCETEVKQDNGSKPRRARRKRKTA